MAELIVDTLSVIVGRAQLLDKVSITVSPGQLVVVIGENGAGKSTLLRAIADFQPGATGRVTVDGMAVSSLSAATRARTMAWLPQSVPLAWPIRVHDAVALGRFAYGAVPGRLSESDSQAVARAMTATDLIRFADRSTATLSGGELARMHLARALASKAPVLIADEPVAALDPRHRLAVMDVIASHVRGGGSALVVLHDLALAARYADSIVAIRGGAVVTAGPVRDVMTPQFLAEVFGVEARVDQIDGRLVPTILR